MKKSHHFIMCAKKHIQKGHQKIKFILGIFIILLIQKMIYMDKLDKKNDLLFNNYKNRYEFILQNLPSYNHTHIYIIMQFFGVGYKGELINQ